MVVKERNLDKFKLDKILKKCIVVIVSSIIIFLCAFGGAGSRRFCRLFLGMNTIKKEEVEFLLTVFELLVKNIIINDEQPWFIKNLIAKMRKVYELLSQNDESAAQQSRLQAWIEQFSWVDPVFCKPEDEVSFRLKVYRQVTSHLYRNYSSKMAINLLGKMACFSHMDIMYHTTDAQKRELVEIALPFGMMVCKRELAMMVSVKDIDIEVAKNLVNSVIMFSCMLYLSDEERNEICSVMGNINSCIIKKKPQVLKSLLMS